MNCEHFQYQVLSGMQDDDAAVLELHQQRCPHCAEHAKQAGLLHDSLVDALQIPVPAHLNEALSTKSFRFNQAVAIGMVSLVLLVGVAAFMIRYPLDSNEPLNSKILNHIQHEQFTLTKHMTPTSRDIKVVFSSLNIELKKPLKQVIFIKRCALNGGPIVHLVVKGEKGPVTVLLFPNTDLKKSQTFAQEQLRGVLQTTKQGHMLAVVGFAGEPLEKQARLFSELL